MRLTTYTDYSLRTLLHIGSNRDRLVTIHEIAELHSISKNHLMKVVHQLGIIGVLETIRGRNGGLRLALEPKDINLGAVVRSTENDFYMAECFNPNGQPCGLVGSCGLKTVLSDATAAYLKVLDSKTLADLLPEPAPAASPIKFHPRAVETES
ncbi:Rrf2 family transcriptional regulator [Massilia sp. 2TAF26]|uniref:RrF2 family transcriptional regulator n=1 Tax=Massilia sp. 2TAF26 TaxID=3233012 RepID=UPI003F97CAAF